MLKHLRLWIGLIILILILFAIGPLSRYAVHAVGIETIRTHPHQTILVVIGMGLLVSFLTSLPLMLTKNPFEGARFDWLSLIIGCFFAFSVLHYIASFYDELHDIVIIHEFPDSIASSLTVIFCSTAAASLNLLKSLLQASTLLHARKAPTPPPVDS